MVTTTLETRGVSCCGWGSLAHRRVVENVVELSSESVVQVLLTFLHKVCQCRDRRTLNVDESRFLLVK